MQFLLFADELELWSTVPELLFYLLIIICVVQFIYIGILLSKKGKAAKSKAAKSKAPSLSQNHNVSLEILMNENDKLNEINDDLNKQIIALKSNVVDLETANTKLLGQKEKLLESKHQLEELQRQKEELFAIAVHDIKNPASAIKGYIELLESYNLNANEQQEIMHQLVDTSTSIISLAQEMAEAITREKPDLGFKYEYSSIKPIVDSVCDLNKRYAQRKNIRLVNKISPNIPKTMFDSSKMEEVLDNLINNAIKYGPTDTVVEVNSIVEEEKFLIEIKDNGIGLSDEDVKRAFEKGVTLSSKPTGEETRSGLGLWIVKKIVEEHEGKVYVKSKLGQGSVFTFELPVRKNL